MKKSKPDTKQLQIEKEDILRDSYVRYLGYSHEIVEGCKQIVPLPHIALQCAYALTAAYILTDVGSKAVPEDGLKAVANIDVLKIANNALLWQFFASIIVPRIAVHSLKQVTSTLIRTYSHLRWSNVNKMSTLLGLGALPVLSKPIDRMVNVMVPPNFSNKGDYKDLKVSRNKQISKTMTDSGQYDIYRDSLLRYLGYCNEIGEAFRALIPRNLVNLSYGVSVTYCLCDTMDKSNRVRATPGKTSTDVAIKAGDVLIWQLLASVVIPGFTINRITKGTRFVIRRYKIPNGKFIPTLIGLASIPIIIHPIDRMVDYLMDNTYRKSVQ